MSAVLCKGKTSTSWRLALLHALPLAAVNLALMTYWFAIADRYIVFLYNHDMGPLYPDTSPFGRVTASRYWMSGLVAGGIVAVFYGPVNWLLGRLAPRYRLPQRRQIWAICAPLLIVGIPAITMTANQPTLPLLNAAEVTLVALIGLALALAPAKLAVEGPGELLWLAGDGFGPMLLLLNLVHLEELSRWLARGGTVWITILAASLFLGMVTPLIVTALGFWRRHPVPSALNVFVAGLFLAYLVMPTVHHLLGTDGYFYISDGDNFFAGSAALQVLTWLAVGGLALGLTRLRRWLAAHDRQVAKDGDVTTAQSGPDQDEGGRDSA